MARLFYGVVVLFSFALPSLGDHAMTFGQNRGRVLLQADLGSTIHGQVTGVPREGLQISAPMCHVTATWKEWVGRLTQGFFLLV